MNELVTSKTMSQHNYIVVFYNELCINVQTMHCDELPINSHLQE